MRIADGCWQRNSGNSDENSTEDVFIGDAWFGSAPAEIPLKKKFPDEKSCGKIKSCVTYFMFTCLLIRLLLILNQDQLHR